MPASSSFRYQAFVFGKYYFIETGIKRILRFCTKGIIALNMFQQLFDEERN